MFERRGREKEEKRKRDGEENGWVTMRENGWVGEEDGLRPLRVRENKKIKKKKTKMKR
jgi:hypothetical protein